MLLVRLLFVMLTWLLLVLLMLLVILVLFDNEMTQFEEVVALHPTTLAPCDVMFG